MEEPPSLKMAAQPEQVLDLLFDQDGVLTTEVTTTQTKVLQDGTMPTLSFVSTGSDQLHVDVFWLISIEKDDIKILKVLKITAAKI